MGPSSYEAGWSYLRRTGVESMWSNSSPAALFRSFGLPKLELVLVSEAIRELG